MRVLVQKLPRAAPWADTPYYVKCSVCGVISKHSHEGYATLAADAHRTEMSPFTVDRADLER